MKRVDEVVLPLKEAIRRGSLAVVGMGNRDRADDGLGLDLAERLKDRRSGLVFSEEERGVEGIVFDLIERDDVDTVVFVDAANFGGQTGELRLFDVHDAERFIPSFSTHKVPITLLMGLVDQKGKTPYLLGVQPKDTTLFSPMTSIVASRLDDLIRVFLEPAGSKRTG